MQSCIRLALMLLVVVLYGNVAAQPGAANEPARKTRDPYFARLDANKDGFLSYQEVREHKETARHFALFDKNLDGKLSEGEFAKLKAAHYSGVQARDGLITSRTRLAVLHAKDLNSASVHVETTAGVVRLSGEVENPKQSARAEQLAARVKDVKKVENNLTIRPAK